jgi:hypothetical protein
MEKKKKLLSVDLTVITDKLRTTKQNLKEKAILGKDKILAKAIEKAEAVSQKQLEYIQNAKRNQA